MERVLNDNEKIRKAEEIYYRRNSNILPKNSVKKTNKLKEKVMLNILILLNIAIIIFCVQNKDFVFTQEFLRELNKYNINISSMVLNFVNSFIEENNEKSKAPEEYINSSEKSENNFNIINENSIETELIVENTENNDSNVSTENISSMSEMEIDIMNLKAAYSFIMPVENAILTSNFGSRVSDNPNVNGYHTGTDFAAEHGEDIKASMQGIVTEVSNDGNYGKHFKIRCNNVTTVYAHCSKIYIQEGQIVAQGQVVGAVGSTGNSTGPHLHFEIRVDDRYVNPEKIL